MECVQGSLDAWLQESALCVHSVLKWDVNNEGGGWGSSSRKPLSPPPLGQSWKGSWCLWAHPSGLMENASRNVGLSPTRGTEVTP